MSRIIENGEFYYVLIVCLYIIGFLLRFITNKLKIAFELDNTITKVRKGNLTERCDGFS